MAGSEAKSGAAERVYLYPGFARPLADSELELTRRLLIADSYARACRCRGKEVFFPLAIEPFGEAVEQEATRQGLSPEELVERFHTQLRQRLQKLVMSCDWPHTVITSEPEHRLRVQQMFLTLLERDLIYRSGSHEDGGKRWMFRSSTYAERCERGLEACSGWGAEELASQRAALGRIEGVELDVGLLGAGNLTVFTPHADSIAAAAFVAMSPRHPQAQAVLESDELTEFDSETTLAQGSLSAVVPGVDGLVPVVITTTVDARFGPSAVLGIPERDETDRQIASRLKAAGGLTMRASSSSAKPRASTRYRLPDAPISRETTWGTPIPVVHCDECGVVPIAEQQLGSVPCKCERCGRPVNPDPAKIEWNLDAMWIWLWHCLSGDRNGNQTSLSLADDVCRLPIRQAVLGAEEDAVLLYQRLSGHVAQDLGVIQSPLDGELFESVSLIGSLSGSGPGEIGIEKLDELVSEVGADVVRFALLHAAAPSKSTRFTEASIRHAERFVGELQGLADRWLGHRDDPIPGEIDPGTRWRRRLSAWCRIGAEKIAADLDRLQMHRATGNSMLLLQRLKDFEQGCGDGAAPASADQDALAIATQQMLYLLEPLLPSLAAEWKMAASRAEAPAS
jgi:leucyl-tRNA synthetase